MKTLYAEIPKIKDDSEKELHYLREKLTDVLNIN